MTVPVRLERVVSLVPSATETLLAWGVPPVAVSRFCEQPGFPTVGGTKDPDVAAIVALAPDLVVLDDQENRREDAEALAAAGVAVHTLHITALAHVRPQLAGLATALGVEVPPCGPDVLSDVAETPPGFVRDETRPIDHGSRSTVDEMAVGTAAGPDHSSGTNPPERSGGGLSSGTNRPGGDAPSSGRRLRAWIPIWKRPWMTVNGDTYASTLLAAIGVDNVAADLPSRYPELDLADAAALAPDVVLAPSEPYPFAERHVAQLSEVAPVVLVDGRDLFWWGVRTVPAMDRLRALLSSRA